MFLLALRVPFVHPLWQCLRTDVYFQGEMPQPCCHNCGVACNVLIMTLTRTHTHTHNMNPFGPCERCANYLAYLKCPKCKRVFCSHRDGDRNYYCPWDCGVTGRAQRPESCCKPCWKNGGPSFRLCIGSCKKYVTMYCTHRYKCCPLCRSAMYV